jgi:hypothetical protein
MQKSKIAAMLKNTGLKSTQESQYGGSPSRSYSKSKRSKARSKHSRSKLSKSRKFELDSLRQQHARVDMSSGRLVSGARTGYKVSMANIPSLEKLKFEEK